MQFERPYLAAFLIVVFVLSVIFRIRKVGVWGALTGRREDGHYYTRHGLRIGSPLWWISLVIIMGLFCAVFFPILFGGN
jgi:hypothetical protein